MNQMSHMKTVTYSVLVFHVLALLSWAANMKIDVVQTLIIFHEATAQEL